MPRLKLLTQLLVATVLFQSCLQDEPIRPSSQTVQFSFALEAKSPDELPAGSTVVLSISTLSGQTRLTDEELPILPTPNGFITEGISLSPDDYVVTEFMVTYNGIALYATPKAGSKLSDRVSVPLAQRLSLNNDTVLPLEVVSTRNASAEEFGYRSLKKTSSPQWKIMVFTRENGALEQSAAWHYVMAPGIAYGGQLQPGMNAVAFDGDPQKMYTLMVEKAGYETYTTDFVYEDIRGKGNKPFKVILNRVENENAFTITPPGAEGDFAFNLGLQGTGSLTIDWGDGTIETINFSPDPGHDDASFVIPRHEYSSALPMNGQISITGDLDQIFVFHSISVYASDIDTRNLTGLQEFSLEGAPINGLLDLSLNSKLQSLRFLGTHVWELRLPESHDISGLFLTAELSEAVVDMLIENVYRNAVAKNITLGYITILAPLKLSAASAERVESLVENYGWELHEFE